MTAALDRGVPGLADEIVRAVVGRLLELEPGACAVVLCGSYARGTADEHSDLDVRAITSGPPRAAYRTWFVERPGAAPLHVSAGAKAMQHWLAASGGPASWSLGLPAEHAAGYLWATAAARARLGDPPVVRQPAAQPEVEDLVEALVKVRRSASAGDHLGARWHARAAAELVPRALLPLNAVRPVRDRREALDAALGLRVAPAGHADDLAAALGLTTAGDAEVARAALRLGRGVLALLREHAADADGQPGVAEALRDGTFERAVGAP